MHVALWKQQTTHHKQYVTPPQSLCLWPVGLARAGQDVTSVGYIWN